MTVSLPNLETSPMVKIRESSPRLLVNLEAIQQNYLYAKQCAPKAVAAAVIKANAYGLKDHFVADALHKVGCQDFFVTNLLEGEALRQRIGSAPNVYIFHGIEDGDEAIYAALNLIPVLNTSGDLSAWIKYAKKHEKRLPALLKINSGMNRLGFAPDELKSLPFAEIQKHLSLKYILSHLACGNDPTNSMNARQLSLFQELTNTYFPGVPRSLAASSILSLPLGYAFDMTRLGICLYGGYAGKKEGVPALKFALSLQARILEVIELAQGDSVGYNARYVAKTPRRIATIGIGYADGLHLSLSGQPIKVRVGQFEAPIIGEISMDMASIDITDIPPAVAHRNTWVDLFYDNMSSYNIVKHCGSSLHELLVRMGMRCNRVYMTGAI